MAGLEQPLLPARKPAADLQFFQGHRPGKDSLHLLPGYGHLDVFFGARAWADTYPIIIKELNRTPESKP